MRSFFSCRKFFLILPALVVLFSVVVPVYYRSTPEEMPSLQLEKTGMSAAFLAKDWAGADALWKDKVNLCSKDISLYLNALWHQGRYRDSLLVLEDRVVEFPEPIQPYAKMLRVLAYERLGEKQKAYKLGEALWEHIPPDLSYYLAYALGRSSAVMDEERALEWYRKMLLSASSRPQKRLALGEMIKFKGVDISEAAELLLLSPSNARALNVLRNTSEIKLSPRAYCALGYHAYVQKQYIRSLPLLQKGMQDTMYGEDARYYYAYSAYRLKRDNEARTHWSFVAATGKEYPQRSIQRLKSLALRSERGKIIQTLSEVARIRSEEAVVLDALEACVALAGPEEKSAAEDVIIRRFPNSVHAARIHWDRGYTSWMAGNVPGALVHWTLGSEANPSNPELASRLLYWQVRALCRLNQSGKAEALIQAKGGRYPFEYHSLMLIPSPSLTDSWDPPVSSEGQAVLLENWGFIPYAISLLAGENTPEARYRSARLAHWSGHYSNAARQAMIYYRDRKVQDPLTLELAYCLFPNAFEQHVKTASGKTGVCTSVIWGIMRQESMFESSAVSHVGAYGLMQLMPATAAAEAQKMKLSPRAHLNPEGNVLLGANHISGLIARFQKIPHALAAYNAGGTPVRRWNQKGITDIPTWIEEIGYRETRGYVKAVMGNIHMYRFLYVDGPAGHVVSRDI